MKSELKIHAGSSFKSKEHVFLLLYIMIAKKDDDKPF